MGTIARTELPTKLTFSEMTVDEIARVCHEVNKDYCESLGDYTQSSWEQAPQWQKDSAKTGVVFHLTNPNAGPDAGHNCWLEQKRAEGWEYGPEKRPEIKQHPCCVPYEMLPQEQKSKDFIFKSIVTNLSKL